MSTTRTTTYFPTDDARDWQITANVTGSGGCVEEITDYEVAEIVDRHAECNRPLLWQAFEALYPDAAPVIDEALIEQAIDDDSAARADAADAHGDR